MRLILVVLITLFSNVVLAIDAYKCTVDYTAGLLRSGELSETDYSKMRQGAEFVVDKETGRIKGGMSNSNYNGQPVVLDYGSSEQAFKVITIFKPMIAVKYLLIEEFVEGEYKPFMFMDGSTMFSGRCAAY